MRNVESELTLTEARIIVQRAVDKARELGQRGAFVVVDDAGHVVTIVRMEDAGPTGVAVARAKAYVAATNREPSARFASRLARAEGAQLFSAYQRVLRKEPFPGAGAMLIRQQKRVLGALSTGAGIGPTVKAAGVDPARFLVDGQPGNAEDIIICHALGIPYEGQHGDDTKRWIEAYGGPPPATSNIGSEPRGAAPPGATSNAPAPPHHASPTSARACIDAVIDRANELGVRVSVVVTDRHGDIVELSRMDGASPATPDWAEAKALTAVYLQRPSADAARLLERDPHLASLADVGKFPLLPIAGGLPLVRDGRVVGAVAVAGVPGDPEEELAQCAQRAFPLD